MSKTTNTNGSHEEKRPAEGAEAAKRQNNTAKARYIELAKKYLREHPKREKYYAVNYRDMGTDLDVGVYVDFTDEEIKCIHHVLDDLTVEYHLPDLLQNPQEIIQDENFNPSYRKTFDNVFKKFYLNQPDILSSDYDFTITDIDFNATTLYTFSRIIFIGFNKKPVIDHFRTSLKDDNDYITLLALKMENRDLSFEELRHIMPEEYEHISCQAVYDDPLLSTTEIYTIGMAEVDEDVFKIIGKKSVSEEIYR